MEAQILLLLYPRNFTIAFETEGTVSVVIHTPINTTHIKGTPLSTVKRRTNYSMIKMAACLSGLRGEAFCDEWDPFTDPPFRFFFRAQQSSAYSRKIFIPSVLIFFKVLPCFFFLWFMYVIAWLAYLMLFHFFY